MTPAPLVTIVIPTRNRREMVSQAIRSALEPVPFSVDVLVSDNASTDDSHLLATLFPTARYIRRDPLLPQFDHFNLCLSEAKGKYIKLLCDDDMILPGALVREVAALEKNPEVVAAASALYEVDHTGEKTIALRRFFAHDVTLTKQEVFREMIKHENLLGPPSTVTFRKSAFEGFPPGFVFASDWAGWILLAERGAITFLSEPGSNFRLQPTSLTLGFVENGQDFLEVNALRRECCRRLTGWSRYPFSLFTAWMFCYRLARRVLRYGTKRRFRGFGTFLGRLASYRAPVLGRSR